MSTEMIAYVDGNNCLLRFGEKKTRSGIENIAVALIIIFDRQSKKVVLFNRGAGASDMKDHWALTAGKVNMGDFSEEEGAVGKPISIDVLKQTAVREIWEELGTKVCKEDLNLVSTFWMERKNLVFSLLAWPIDERIILRENLDGEEVDEHRSFSLQEFTENESLGDAIRYRLTEITAFLKNEFN